MGRTDNPFRDFLFKEEEDDDWLQSRPICDQCGEHIQDEYYWLINGEKFCESCLDWHKQYID